MQKHSEKESRMKGIFTDDLRKVLQAAQNLKETVVSCSRFAGALSAQCCCGRTAHPSTKEAIVRNRSLLCEGL